MTGKYQDLDREWLINFYSDSVMFEPSIFYRVKFTLSWATYLKACLFSLLIFVQQLLFVQPKIRYFDDEIIYSTGCEKIENLVV